MPQYFPSVSDMLDINTAIIVLVVTIVVGFTGLVGTGFAIMKWYLPSVFKRRDEQRQTENDALKKELENKNAATAVDIERERMFPQMMENNQRLVESMLQSNRANTEATIQRIEQDKHSAAVLEANTKQLTTAAERLDESTEKLEAVERKVDQLYNRFSMVFPREKSIDELFTELKLVVAGTKQVVDERKTDSRPIPTIHADVTLHTDNGNEPPTLPDLKESA
jgi:hypothetical protein